MHRSLLTIVSLMMILSMAHAQRKVQSLGRGVVAVQSGTNVNITWRRLAQESEDAKYNVYVSKTADGTRTLLNAKPLSLTNYQTTLTKVPYGSYVSVSILDNGKESAPSHPFHVNHTQLGGIDIKGAYMAVNFSEAGSPIKNTGDVKFVTKYCWPVDLDGDGEMDYVVNRIYTAKNQDGCEGWGEDKLGGDCLEAYSSEGKHLWTVNLGIHFYAFGGQNDGVTVGDFDGDGRGEVIVQVCEGARFWDKANSTFGKYLYYNGTQASSKGSGTQIVSSDGSQPDIDGDGITNYTWYDKGKNPQWYFAVIDGLTGEQKDACAMTLPSDGDMTYTRTNKSTFMGEEYSYLSPAMGTAYLDGVNQSAVAQFQCRTQDGNHHYFTYAYGYEGGEFKELWRFKFHEHKGLSEFHHIRIGDVDGDGKDEVMNGQCAVKGDGTLLWSSGISHGDRFRMSDIDPDRPGQEIFAIQQNAGDMLGMILYDAKDGTAIKKWYLPAVGDVGRGECMDIDPSHKGYEIWSTMENLYDCKGNQISTSKPYPTEGIWWDADLAREAFITSGSGNNCPGIVAKYDNGGWSRLYEISKNSSWQLVVENGVRPMFWGDIYGDWREELILKVMDGGSEVGFCCLSTDYATTVKNIYCLLQDPNYRGQITNRGYYQSPNTSFYLGYDMPRPPLPPFMQETDDSEVFGLTLSNATISPDATKAHHYIMPVLGQTFTLGELSTQGEMWKSQPGTLSLATSLTAGHLYISEGAVVSQSAINAPVDLRARGTLMGSPTLQDTIIFEGALNSVGCRLIPQGTMTFQRSLNLPSQVWMEMTPGDLIHVEGNVKATGDPVFHIMHEGDIPVGEYRLMEYTGTLAGFSRFRVEGLTGQRYSLINRDQAIILVIEGQREAATDVVWSGATNSTWDYQTENWTHQGEGTAFVAGDEVWFTDEASRRTVTLGELIPAGKVVVTGTKAYTFNGDGGLTGNCALVKEGTGSLTLNITHSNYTGDTEIKEGTVTVKQLADTGIESSLGSQGNISLGLAKLIINNANTSTDRSFVLTDSATIQIANGTTALKGVISGKGSLTKTGAGQLNINNKSNTWTGGTVLSAGTLAQGSWDAQIGKTGSNIWVTGNATYRMFDCNSSSTMPNSNYAFHIAEGKTLTFAAGSRCTINGSLRGKGTYKISLPYVRGDISTNTSQFEGIYEVASTNCRFVQAMDLSMATLKLDEGAYAAGYKSGKGDEAVYTHKIGTLTGTGTLGTGTWQISRLLVNYKSTRTTATCDAVTINGSATLRNLVIDMRSSSTAMPDDAEFTVLKGTGKRTVSGAVTVLPETPKDGYEWDTSRLASEGILTIKPLPDNMEKVEVRQTVDSYDLSGRKITPDQYHGIRITNGHKYIR